MALSTGQLLSISGGILQRSQQAAAVDAQTELFAKRLDAISPEFAKQFRRMPLQAKLQTIGKDQGESLIEGLQEQQAGLRQQRLRRQLTTPPLGRGGGSGAAQGHPQGQQRSVLPGGPLAPQIQRARLPAGAPKLHAVRRDRLDEVHARTQLREVVAVAAVAATSAVA